MEIRFNPASPIPAVRQITDNLRVLLVSKEIAPGARLPSVRRLAMELGVHFNTVAEAYRELAAEGWLELQHGRAAIVLPRRVRKAASSDWLEAFRSRMDSLIAQVRAQGADSGDIALELRAIAKELRSL